MDAGNLVNMANSIGVFFASMPDEDDALYGVKDHLRKYWPPLMRMHLLTFATTDEAHRLHSLVISAIDRYSEELMSRRELG